MRALSLAHCSIKSAHAEMERQSTKRRSSHERYSKKSQVVLSKMDGMKHECSKLRDISPIFLHGIPLPDIKVVEVFIPKTPRELCSFGCLLCIITYQKKKKSTLKTPAVLLPQNSHPQLLWVASTPPSWAPLWLPPHLPITRLVASPAPPLRPSALQRVAVVTTARCGRAAPGAVMGSFGWSLGGVAASWFLVGKRCVVFLGGPNITKSKCEKERDSK